MGAGARRVQLAQGKGVGTGVGVGEGGWMWVRWRVGILQGGDQGQRGSGGCELPRQGTGNRVGGA